MDFKDYYKSLGVQPEASPDEIRKAFRKLAREYHPDVAKNKAVAEEKFKEINEAYEVLGDVERRRKYDSIRQSGGGMGGMGGFGPPPGWDADQRSGSSRMAYDEGGEFQFGGTG